MENNKAIISIRIAKDSELENFKKDLQEAFKVSAEKEFGHPLEEPIPSDEDIEKSFRAAGSIVYQVLANDEIAGGAIVSIDEVNHRNKLLLFYINTHAHGRGIGYEAWKRIEEQHPKTAVWETVTPYFEKRNIHFYVNKCGFKIVDYYNKYHPDPNQTSDNITDEENDEMFRFEKIMSYSTPTPIQVVQAQLEAYNAKDIEALLATYAPDGEQYTLHGELLAKGHEQMRQRFLARFAEPNLYAKLLSRTVIGNIVTDAELITRDFPEGLGTVEMLCIYEVSEGRIQKVSFVMGQKTIFGRS